MKTDTYTKVVLTGIAICLGVIAFDYKPTINAQASSSNGGVMLTAHEGVRGVYHLKDGKIRLCDGVLVTSHECSEWK